MKLYTPDTLQYEKTVRYQKQAREERKKELQKIANKARKHSLKARIRKDYGGIYLNNRFFSTKNLNTAKRIAELGPLYLGGK